MWKSIDYGTIPDAIIMAARAHWFSDDDTAADETAADETTADGTGAEGTSDDELRDAEATADDDAESQA